MFGLVGATNFGSLAGMLFSHMFSKLEITLGAETLTILGTSVLMARPEICIPFKGPYRLFRPSAPIPLANMLNEHKVIGWLDRDANGRPRHN